ncbi:MAG: radical SAM protein [Prevotellaceae bacterium]|jgi:radical SAM protein with 4Fe4S-binding SPASM domain|nr:radical SAM protein [Prevotellaceae bacterium]
MFGIFIHYKQLLRVIRCTSLRKLANYAKLTVSYRFSLAGKRFFADQRPCFISIEPADFCNLRCPECPVGMRSGIKRPQKTMDADLYRKLIDELSPALLHAIFYFQGEPLLCKHLPEMIRYAHDAKIYTSTSTNAQNLNEELAGALIRSGLDKLIISIDGSDQETYERYRIGGSLQKAMDGTRRLTALKKQWNKTNPFVEIQCLLLNGNEHHMEDMKKLAKELGADKLTFKTAQFYDFENGNPLLPENPAHSRYKKQPDGKYILKKRLRNRCRRLWTGAVVNTNGDVLPCCFDKDGRFAFGNIRNDSFSGCWHSEKALRFREKILENRKQFEMCRNCTS